MNSLNNEVEMRVGYDGSMAKVTILLLVIGALYFRPNGLFASKVRR